MHNPHLRQAKARIGSKAGKYTLESLIDVGGMAAVYRGKRWRGEVAIKVLHRAYCRIPEAIERFGRESLAANRIDHPDVVKVIDHGELEDGTPFFTMDLLHGSSLEQRLAKKPRLPAGEVLHLAERVADVLVGAHAVGVVHRDIKPGNLFLTTAGEIKMLDFGLARLLDGGAQSTTRTGTVIGTATYMSPEQALRDPKLIDARTDLWSLGAVMFRALSGRTVHQESAQGPALIAAATRAAPSLATVASANADIVAIVDKALAFDKADRFDDATMFRDAVRAAQAGAPLGFPVRDEQPAEDAEDVAPISVAFSDGSEGESILIEPDFD